ncbi:rhodanese-like domain-containing protein [Croceivirga lutea]|uniref:rhodanese-like domain-containing protein n=1 Tax=Croceivirga lutea TaxID=1775167 RepID=UPI00163B1773
MRIHYILFLLFVIPLGCLPQKNIDKTLEKMNSGSVSYVTPQELPNQKVVLLDTRELEEFKVSHLKDALWVGYKDFDITTVLENIPEKETPIVVYCSIGVRSEDIGEELQKAGYTNIKNLYGGIFEWKNQDKVVIDSLGQETENIHAYSKYWGKLLTKGNKVY